MSDIQYPTRCKIVDVDGIYDLKTPEISKPHVGKKGKAVKRESGLVKIYLDDGNSLMGYECWWIPIT